MGKTDWEKTYWADINPVCKSCIHSCKQSRFMTLVNCPIYEPKKRNK